MERVPRQSTEQRRKRPEPGAGGGGPRHALCLGTLVLLFTAPSPVHAAPLRITLVATGDVMFGRYQGRDLRRHGYVRPFRFVQPLWAGAQIVVGNLETPITASRRAEWPSGWLRFRAEPRAAGLLREAGFTLVSLANNHAHDQGDEGLLETMGHLARAGLPLVGAGRTAAEAVGAKIVEARGVKLALLAATELRSAGQLGRRTCTALLEEGGAPLLEEVRRVRPAVDFVVVLLHSGVEYEHEPGPRERALVDGLTVAGADLVIGHHPHVLRGLERRGRTVVYHSLGNLLFDTASGVRAQAAVARVTFLKQGAERRIERAELVPVQIDELPRPARGAQARAILDEVVRLTTALGATELLRGVESLEVRLR